MAGSTSGRRRRVDHGAVAPAVEMLDEVAGLEAVVPGLLDDTDGIAFERLADLERRDIARAVDHAAAHIGIDRHPQRLDEELAVGERGQGLFDKGEIFRAGKG